MTTPTIPDWPVSYRVRRALDLADVEPKELAAYIGVHPNTVWNYLNGKRQPKRLVLRAVSDLTGVPLWWLEGGESPESDTEAVTLRHQSAEPPTCGNVIPLHRLETGNFPPVTDKPLPRAS